MKICAIVAMSENRAIGINGGIPWHLPEDMKHFRELTTGQIVLMGRKTWQSLPQKFRPLPNRENIVLSRQKLSLPEGVNQSSTLEETLIDLKEQQSVQTLWIIGGAQVYQESLPFWDEVHLTLVKGEYKADAFFPIFEDRFTLADKVTTAACDFLKYVPTVS